MRVTQSTDQKVGGSSPSERAQVRAPSKSGRGSFANTVANSGTLAGGRHGAGEDVGGLGELIADDVRVHAQRNRGVRMAEPDGDHVHRDASQQQGGGVDVPQVV
jgi:hypothetical protein